MVVVSVSNFFPPFYYNSGVFVCVCVPVVFSGHPRLNVLFRDAQINKLTTYFIVGLVLV